VGNKLKMHTYLSERNKQFKTTNHHTQPNKSNGQTKVSNKKK